MTLVLKALAVFVLSLQTFVACNRILPDESAPVVSPSAYDDYEMSMSMPGSGGLPSGKGYSDKWVRPSKKKGGKGKGMGKGKGTGKGKGMRLPSKKSTGKKAKKEWKMSGKKGGKKSAKFGKGKGKGKGKGNVRRPTTGPITFAPGPPSTLSPGMTPSPAPVASLEPATNPPTPISSGEQPATVVPLSPYSIFYTIDIIRLPDDSDYAGLGAETQTYLDGYFSSNFASIPEVSYSTSATGIVGQNFVLGEPVQVDYNTNITFGASTITIPSVAELDALLLSAFNGDNTDQYLAALANLDSTNIFSTTSNVTVQQETAAPTSPSPVKIAGIAAAGAAGLVLLAAGAVAFRQRMSTDERVDEYLKNNDEHMSVAGETALESTLDGQSGIHQLRTFDGDSSVDGSEYSNDGHRYQPSDPQLQQSALEEVPEDTDENDAESEAEEPVQLEQVQL